jgi:glutathione peroxidase
MRRIVRKLLKLGLVATLAGCFFGKSKTVDSQTIQKAKPMKPFYSIKINSLEGKEINLEDYKGKKILVVNTASECGFTPQYEDLQKLHETYGEKVVIIGTPCNQFGGQEPWRY